MGPTRGLRAVAVLRFYCSTPMSRRCPVASWPLATRFPDVNLLQATASSCVPTLDTQGDPRCTKLDSGVLGRISRVVPADRWRDEHAGKLLATVSYLHAKGVA
jgi:hypothetical protein